MNQIQLVYINIEFLSLTFGCHTCILRTLGLVQQLLGDQGRRLTTLAARIRLAHAGRCLVIVIVGTFLRLWIRRLLPFAP